ncbi:MAG: PQQ-binding-like beta-propeller repeat protein [Acidobacteriaceae bacterium]|nr:PQQ-binding-like beta-propeller repeat protein [Acidobacteriaceae bacterium]
MRYAWLLILSLPLQSQITYNDLLTSPAEYWATYHGDYRAQRFSPLKQIDTGTVSQTVPKWTFHVDGARRLETSPVVFDGVMYVTNSNTVYALDARTGKSIWKYKDQFAAKEGVNRGVAILGDSVYFVTADCYLVSLHRTSGAILFHRKFADVNQGYFATLAPLALRDQVIVGVSGGDSGMRGFVAALSARDGNERWRFYTVPAKGEPASETWGEFDTQWGGGATWMTGTYDPDLNTLYWATGNPWPDYKGGGRRGANLYTDSVVALDAASGKLRWYFQFTPHDTHDWDAQSIPVLVDLEFDGRARRVLLHPNRNGFFYVLDRVTGQFLCATPFVEKLDWAKGIDASGKPIEIPDMQPVPGGRRVCPSVRGASNWMSPSYSPITKLLYVPALEECDLYTEAVQNPEPMKDLEGGGAESIPDEPGKFYLRALDPVSGKRVWQYPMTGRAEMWAGALSTAGGLVFFGDDDGSLVALEASTGKYLWHYYMAQTLTASPITYSVGGSQYVAIAAGTEIFAFGLLEPGTNQP